MIIYKQILEAVNKGIQLALDDFEDDEEQVLNNIKSKQVYNRDYTKEYIDLMKDVVDLGLPSRTLWCKYNLGVNPNLLNTPEGWYGDYYAWGELKPNKPEFSWFTYKYAEHYTDLSEKECLTKYCNNPRRGYNQITKSWGFTDNLTELLPEDDAAYQNKHIGNYKFHMPTKELYEELIKYTKNYLVKNYDPNKVVHHTNDGGIQGLNGRVFEGKNGNLIFIPAAGRHSGSDVCDVGSDCDLWSSSLNLDYSTYAYKLAFFSDNIFISDIYRYIGCSVRPVINL